MKFWIEKIILPLKTCHWQNLKWKKLVSFVTKKQIYKNRSENSKKMEHTIKKYMILPGKEAFFIQLFKASQY